MDKRGLKGDETSTVEIEYTLEDDLHEKVLSRKPFPPSVLKKHLSMLYKWAAQGLEILTAKGDFPTISLVNTDVLAVLLDNLDVSVEERNDENGRITISILHTSIQEEGQVAETHDIVVKKLMADLTNHICLSMNDASSDEMCSTPLSPLGQAIILKLNHIIHKHNGDITAIRKTLGL